MSLLSFRIDRVDLSHARVQSELVLRSCVLLGTLLMPSRLVAQTPPQDIRSIVAELTAIAQSSDPAAMRARRALESVRASRGAAGRAAPAEFGVGVVDGNGFDVPRGNVEASVSRLFVRVASRTAAERRVDAEIRDAERAVLAVERRLAPQVLEALAAATTSERVVRRLRRSDALLDEAERALNTRFAAGAARYVDVLRVRTERLRTAAEVTQAEAESVAADAALRALVATDGMDTRIDELLALAASDELSAEWPRALVPFQETDSLVEWSPDVREAIARADRSRAEAAVVSASQRAQFGGSAGLQRMGPINGGPSAGLIVGFSATLPFTASRANRSAAEAARLGLDAAQHGLAEVRRRVSIDVSQQVVRYEAARARIAALDGVLLVAAEQERETALAHYRAGTLTLLELLDFERALLRVELDRANAIRDAASVRAALLGGSIISTPEMP
jgi:cobalt-zinc-cadmium efflux system outer membrane protein